jgi:hypothetical protein
MKIYLFVPNCIVYNTGCKKLTLGLFISNQIYWFKNKSVINNLQPLIIRIPLYISYLLISKI